jgi:hypothetical protein
MYTKPNSLNTSKTSFTHSSGLIKYQTSVNNYSNGQIVGNGSMESQGRQSSQKNNNGGGGTAQSNGGGYGGKK